MRSPGAADGYGVRKVLQAPARQPRALQAVARHAQVLPAPSVGVVSVDLVRPELFTATAPVDEPRRTTTL